MLREHVIPTKIQHGIGRDQDHNSSSDYRRFTSLSRTLHSIFSTKLRPYSKNMDFNILNEFPLFLSMFQGFS
jgi:hypothetical protein